MPCHYHLPKELARQEEEAPVVELLKVAACNFLHQEAGWEEIVSYLQANT